MLTFNTQTVLIDEISELIQWMKNSGMTAVDIVLDSSIVEQPATKRLVTNVAQIFRNTCVTTYQYGHVDAPLQNKSFVIAVGGGSCLDEVKLLTYISSLECHKLPNLETRNGFLIFPELNQRSHILAAIPTTLGTGSEASQVAVIKNSNHRKLATAVGLAPTLAWHDASFLQGLPPYLLHEGALEIFARLLGSYIATQEDNSRVEDAVVHGYMSHIAATLVNPSILSHPSWQEDLLRIGARSHQTCITYKRPYYGVKWWPIVNEICAVTGERKIPILASILPQIFIRIMNGDTRWGDPIRLKSIWKILRDNTQSNLPSDLIEGVNKLFDSTIHPQSLKTLDISVTAAQIMHAWGNGLPMFCGFKKVDIEHLLEDAIDAIRLRSTPRPIHVN